ncbi:MAG: hypothetical protein GXY74_07940 [Phycisphaerae bacterium]|nr:hypothetical protein [Phycisphaerae bacterium]
MAKTQRAQAAAERSRGPWRTLAVLVPTIAVLAVAAAPSLIPSDMLSEMIRKDLEASLSRKVSVADCSVGWLSGVKVGQLRVASASGDLDAPAIAIRGLHLNYEPWELVAAARAERPHLGRAVIEWLGVRVVRQADGRLDILESSGPPPDFQSVDIRNGMIHLVDLQADTRRYVSQVRLTLGRLARSEKAYVTGGGLLHFPADGEAEPSPESASPTAAGPLPGVAAGEAGLTPVGVLSISGFLDHFDLNNFAGIVGGCDIEWKSVNLGYLFPRGSALPGGLRIDAPTSGEVNLTIDQADRIGIRGRVSASQVQLGVARRSAALVDMSLLTVGFAGTYNKTTGDIRISPIQISGAGSSVHVDGDLVRKADGRLEGELSVRGMISWAPLKEDVPPLGGALSGLAAATGTAAVNHMNVTFAGDTARVLADDISLDRTELEWKPLLSKPAGRRARLALDASADLRTGRVSLASASLRIGQAGPDGHDEIVVTATTPTPGGDAAAPGAVAEDEGAAGGEAIRIEVSIPDAELLPRHVPATEELIRRFNVSGSLSVEALLRREADDVALAVTVDAGALAFETGPGATKASGVPLRVRAEGVLKGETGQPECRGVEAVLADSRLIYKGRAYRAAAAGGQPPHVAFGGRLDVTGIQQWLRLVRPYVSRTRSPALVGNLRCELDGRVGADQWQLDLEADASRASVELIAPDGSFGEAVPPLLAKPLGDEASLRLKAAYDVRSDTLTIPTAEIRFADSVLRLEGSLAGATGLAEPAARAPTLPARVSLEVVSEDVRAMLTCLPWLQSQLKAQRAEGGLSARVSATLDERVSVEARVDLTDTGYTAQDGELTKARGMRQTFALRASRPTKVAGNLRRWTIDQTSLELGPARATLAGTVELDADVMRGMADWTALRHVMRSVDLAGNATLVEDQSLRAFSRSWNRLCAEYNLSGRATADLRLRGSRGIGELRLTVDATEATFQYGMRGLAGAGEAQGPFVVGEATLKPVGTRAMADVWVRRAPLAGEFEIEKATLDIADTHVTCKGTLYCRDRLPLRPGDILGCVLDLEGRSEQLARLAHLVPLRGLRQLDPQGGVAFSMSVAADPYSLELTSGDFTFEKARVTYRGEPVAVNGRLVLGRPRLLADALAVSVAGTSLTVAADIAEPFDAPKGRLSVTGERLDLDRLMAMFGIEAPDAAHPVIGIPSDWPALASFLSRMDVDGELAFGEFKWTDDKKLRYDWNAFVADFTLDGGWFDVRPFKAVMFGGVVIGHIATDFREANPELLVEYSTRNLQAGPGLNAMVKLQFPDMTVNGSSDSVYQARQRLFATAEQFNWPVGMTEFEARDGTMVGPAAPEWLANLFPGMKLSRYDFRRMRSVSHLMADGSSESEMLFDGSPYAVYITGRTGSDGTARYSLGVDLMNSLESGETARKLEQGRIPLLTYSGRIASSTWADRDVSYKLAHEVAYDVFLKRNILFRLLRALGDKRRPDFEPYKGMFDTNVPEPPESDGDRPPDAGEKRP